VDDDHHQTIISLRACNIFGMFAKNWFPNGGTTGFIFSFTRLARLRKIHSFFGLPFASIISFSPNR
jgi:hypothetical protein